MKIESVIIFAFALIIVVLSVGLFSCNGVVSVASDSEVSRMMGEEVPIGVVVALTGKYAEAYGFSMQRGFELAREDINRLGGVNLRFITVDDQPNLQSKKNKNGRTLAYLSFDFELTPHCG